MALYPEKMTNDNGLLAASGLLVNLTEAVADSNAMTTELNIKFNLMDVIAIGGAIDSARNWLLTPEGQNYHGQDSLREMLVHLCSKLGDGLSEQFPETAGERMEFMAKTMTGSTLGELVQKHKESQH